MRSGRFLARAGGLGHLAKSLQRLSGRRLVLLCPDPRDKGPEAGRSRTALRSSHGWPALSTDAWLPNHCALSSLSAREPSAKPQPPPAPPGSPDG